MLKSKKLEKGQTIGVVSPASPSFNKSQILRGKETLESLGYKVILSKNLNKTKGLVSASEEERAQDINDMFRHDEIDAIFVSQGGYGSAQLISRLDYDVIRQNPKIFTGFSDITSLHLAIGKFAGLITFHGPGMGRFNSEDLTDYTRDSFFRALSQTEPAGEIRPADEKKWLNPIGAGQCEAPLAGGNLTLICASLGTPYEIDTKGKILLIEDIETEPWVFDHMLCHLRNAGKLNDLAGIVVGECVKCEPRKHDPAFFCDTSLEDVLAYYIEPLKIPAVYGLPLGHTKDLATLPLGVMARLDADAKKLIILESGVK